MTGPSTLTKMYSSIPLHIIYTPLELILQRADGESRLNAALDACLLRTAILLKKEVPPLWRPGSNSKHSQADISGETGKKKKSQKGFESRDSHFQYSSV